MQGITTLLEKAEVLIYILAGVLLTVAALAVMGYAMIVFAQHVTHGEVIKGIVELLELLLLGLMSVELLYTVMVSLRTHSLSAEPFLIVGLVAAVRRVLTLSVEAAHLFQTNRQQFHSALYEIGLLAVTIFILVASIYLLRRSPQQKNPLEERPGTP